MTKKKVETPIEMNGSSILANKVDFAAIISATMCNPNGDPQDDNRPRVIYLGPEIKGLISDVCIKRKMRNYMAAMGYDILARTPDTADGFKSKEERVAALSGSLADVTQDSLNKTVCEKYVDARAFGDVTFLKNTLKVAKKIPACKIHGPVTIQQALSVWPIEIIELSITKAENGVKGEDNEEMSSDRMGTRSIVPFGCYLVKGSINVPLAEKTGFTVQDAELLKQSLCNMFLVDASSSRPEGSMSVERVFWWVHNNRYGQVPARKLYDAIKIEPIGVDIMSMADFNISVEPVFDANGNEVFCEDIICG